MAQAPDTGPCTCVTLRRASRAITQVYDLALAPVGLLVTQFSLLRAVERLAEPSITALAGRMALDRSTLTRNLSVLADEGLLRIAKRGRTRTVTLTPKGMARIAQGLELWRQAEARVSKELGPKILAAIGRARITLESLEGAAKP